MNLISLRLTRTRALESPLVLRPMHRSRRRITDIGMSEDVELDYSDASIATVE